MMFDDDRYIPSPSYNRLTEIDSLASYITKRMIASRNTIATSNDTDEKIDAIASIVMCDCSLSLLLMSYLTENAAFIEQAKNIYRGIDR